MNENARCFHIAGAVLT